MTEQSHFWDERCVVGSPRPTTDWAGEGACRAQKHYRFNIKSKKMTEQSHFFSLCARQTSLPALSFEGSAGWPNIGARERVPTTNEGQGR